MGVSVEPSDLKTVYENLEKANKIIVRVNEAIKEIRNDTNVNIRTDSQKIEIQDSLKEKELAKKVKEKVDDALGGINNSSVDSILNGATLSLGALSNLGDSVKFGLEEVGTTIQDVWTKSNESNASSLGVSRSDYLNSLEIPDTEHTDYASPEELGISIDGLSEFDQMIGTIQLTELSEDEKNYYIERLNLAYELGESYTIALILQIVKDKNTLLNLEKDCSLLEGKIDQAFLNIDIYKGTEQEDYWIKQYSSLLEEQNPARQAIASYKQEIRQLEKQLVTLNYLEYFQKADTEKLEFSADDSLKNVLSILGINIDEVNNNRNLYETLKARVEQLQSENKDLDLDNYIIALDRYFSNIKTTDDISLDVNYMNQSFWVLVGLCEIIGGENNTTNLNTLSLIDYYTSKASENGFDIDASEFDFYFGMEYYEYYQALQYMTIQERNVYDRICFEEGKTKADEFLHNISDNLIKRQAHDEAEQMYLTFLEHPESFDRIMSELGYSIENGVISHFEHWGQFLTGDESITVNEYKGQFFYEMVMQGYLAKKQGYITQENLETLYNSEDFEITQEQMETLTKLMSEKESYASLGDIQEVCKEFNIDSSELVELANQNGGKIKISQIEQLFDKYGSVAMSLLDHAKKRGSGINQYDILYATGKMDEEQYKFLQNVWDSENFQNFKDTSGVIEEWFAKYTWSAGVSFGNMIPSIAIGAILSPVGALEIGGVTINVSQIASSVSMFGSASGDSMAEAKRKGYDTGTAYWYGALSGLSEVATEHFLGTIPFVSRVSNVLSVDSSGHFFKSMGLAIAKDILGEVTEENVQIFIDEFLNVNVLAERASSLEEILTEMKDTTFSTILSTLMSNGSTATINLGKYAFSVTASDISFIRSFENISESKLAFEILANAKINTDLALEQISTINDADKRAYLVSRLATDRARIEGLKYVEKEQSKVAIINSLWNDKAKMKALPSLESPMAQLAIISTFDVENQRTALQALGFIESEQNTRVNSFIPSSEVLNQDRTTISSSISNYINGILTEFNDAIPQKIKDYFANLGNIEDIVHIDDTGTISLFVQDGEIFLPKNAYNVLSLLSKLPGFGINKNHTTHGQNDMVINNNTFLSFVNHVFLKGLSPQQYFSEIALHETFHLCGSDGAFGLFEGITEFKTREFAQKHNLETSACGYPKETRIAYELQQLFGKDVMDKITFAETYGDKHQIINDNLGETEAELFKNVFAEMQLQFNPYISKSYPGFLGIINKCYQYSKIDYSKAHDLINEYRKSHGMKVVDFSKFNGNIDLQNIFDSIVIDESSLSDLTSNAVELNSQQLQEVVEEMIPNIETFDVVEQQETAPKNAIEPNLWNSETMPLSEDPVLHELQQRKLNGEKLSVMENVKLALRDNTVRELFGYQLQPTHAYRAVSAETLEIYKQQGYIIGRDNDQEYMEFEENGVKRNNNAGVDWYLGGVSLKYGDFIIECEADKDYFVPASDNGTHMSQDLNVRHMKSSPHANPVPYSKILRIFNKIDGTVIDLTKTSFNTNQNVQTESSISIIDDVDNVTTNENSTNLIIEQSQPQTIQDKINHMFRNPSVFFQNVENGVYTDEELSEFIDKLSEMQYDDFSMIIDEEIRNTLLFIKENGFNYNIETTDTNEKNRNNLVNFLALAIMNDSSKYDTVMYLDNEKLKLFALKYINDDYAISDIISGIKNKEIKLQAIKYLGNSYYLKTILDSFKDDEDAKFKGLQTFLQNSFEDTSNIQYMIQDVISNMADDTIKQKAIQWCIKYKMLTSTYSIFDSIASIKNDKIKYNVLSEYLSQQEDNDFSYQICDVAKVMNSDRYKLKIIENYFSKQSSSIYVADIIQTLQNDNSKIKALKYVEQYRQLDIVNSLSSDGFKIKALKYLNTIDMLEVIYLFQKEESKLKAFSYMKNELKVDFNLLNNQTSNFNTTSVFSIISTMIDPKNKYNALQYLTSDIDKYRIILTLPDDLKVNNLLENTQYKMAIIKSLSDDYRKQILLGLYTSIDKNEMEQILLTFPELDRFKIIDECLLPKEYKIFVMRYLDDLKIFQEAMEYFSEEDKIELFKTIYNGVSNRTTEYIKDNYTNYLLNSISKENLLKYCYEDILFMNGLFEQNNDHSVATWKEKLTADELRFLQFMDNDVTLFNYIKGRFTNIEDAISNFFVDGNISTEILDELLYYGEWESFIKLSQYDEYDGALDLTSTFDNYWSQNPEKKVLYEKIFSIYNNLRYNLKAKFKSFVMTSKNISVNQLNNIVTLLNKIEYSNSSEISHFGNSLLSELLTLDDPMAKFEQVEDIFVRNNLPIVAKLFLVNMILHPNLNGFDFSDNSTISPILKFSSPRRRESLIFADLLKSALGSNNRSIQEYLINIQSGNSIFEKIGLGEISIEELTTQEKATLDIFIAHLNTLYNNTLMGQDSNRKISEDLITDAKELYQLFSRDGIIDYNLPNRIVRMFGYMAGFNTYDEMINYLNFKTQQADERNRQTALNGLNLSQGDLVKGIGDIRYIENILQNGSVSKEFLGDSSTSDWTPLDTDLSIIQNDGTLAEMIESTQASGYGSIWLVLNNDDRFVITRTESGDMQDNIRDLSKLELFYTGANGEGHYGIRIGFASSEINAIVVDRYDNTLGFEIARNGFYIPVYDKNTEQLVFTPDDYDNLRKRMSGLKYYGSKTYQFSDNLMSDDVRRIVDTLGDNEKVVSEKRGKIQNTISNVLEQFGLKLKTELDGDLSEGYVELIDTGSTGRGTNKNGDGDFDFMMKLDANIIKNGKRMSEIRSAILKALGRSEHDYIGSGDLRLKNVTIDGIDVPVDIDVSFVQKTNKVTYSTDMALRDKLQTIKEQDHVKYQEVLANIQLAKDVLKYGECYKPNRGDNPQGGLGGVGVENWILQNGGSFEDAAMDFLRKANGKTFEQFKREYQVWDFGENHFAEIRDNYKHDEFVSSNMSAQGYYKMIDTLSKYFNVQDQITVRELILE